MTFTVSSQLAGSVAVLALLLGLQAYIYWLLRGARRRGTYSPLTEDLLRLPGHALRIRRDKLLDEMTEIYLGFLFVTIPAVVLLSMSKHWFVRSLIGAVAIAALVYIAIRIARLVDRIRAVSLGLECEEYTGQGLNLLLRDGAFVIHDIPYRYGNIDHVVVGHGRALAVETKGRRKPTGPGSQTSRDANVRFDGRSLSFAGVETAEPIDQARRHAKFLAEAIEKRCGFRFEVLPVVAIPWWYIDAPQVERGGVLVVNPKRAKALIRVASMYPKWNLDATTVIGRRIERDQPGVSPAVAEPRVGIRSSRARRLLARSHGRPPSSRSLRSSYV